MHEENAFFVCPDSAVPHCTEKQWRERKDVYRLALSLCRYYQEVTDERPPLYIRDNLLYLNGCVEEINDSIWRSEFVMKPQKFKVYMEADCLYWYDPSDPERINPDADSYDVFAYNEQFSITVRPQFSLLDRYLYERRMRQE